MNGEDDLRPPLVEDSVLERLRAEVDDDPGIWKVFIGNYLARLASRVERLRHTLTAGDVEGAMDAVLTLRTSSEMVAALRLASLARELEVSLRRTQQDGDPALALPNLAGHHLGGISLCALRTSVALRSQLR